MTKVIIQANNYNKALALLENGKYTEAIAAFEALGDYKDAAVLEENGEYGKVAIAFEKLGDYRDAKERSLALWEQVAQRDAVSAGGFHTVGLKSDGTVVTVGDNDGGQCDVSDWTDIKLPRKLGE